MHLWILLPSSLLIWLAWYRAIFFLVTSYALLITSPITFYESSQEGSACLLQVKGSFLFKSGFDTSCRPCTYIGTMEHAIIMILPPLYRSWYGSVYKKQSQYHTNISNFNIICNNTTKTMHIILKRIHFIADGFLVRKCLNYHKFNTATFRKKYVLFL